MRHFMTKMAIAAATLGAGAAHAQTCSSPMGHYGTPVTGTEEMTLGPVLQYNPEIGGSGVGSDGFVTTECNWFQQGFEASDGKVSGRVWLYTGASPEVAGSFVVPLDPVAFPAGGGGNGTNFPHAECQATLATTGDEYAAGYPNPFWPHGSTVQEGRYNNTPTTYTDTNGDVFPPNTIEFYWKSTFVNLDPYSTYSIDIFCPSKAAQ
jgi:hypothetical protein